MPFYHRVLVGVDGSPASLHALRQACRLGTLDLWAAAVIPGGAEMAGSAPPQVRRLYEEALSAAHGVCRQAGRNLKTHLLSGDPQACLVELARGGRCDLIVMGLKGAGPALPALMGSVTARVIGYSSQDVLVIPPQSALAFQRLLLPTDGSRYSRLAENRALELAAAHGGELLALTVLDVPPGFEEELAEVAAELRQKAAQDLEALRERALARGLACRCLVQQGPVYREILAAAEAFSASLIVMGSHGRTGLKRLLMGSVTERVLGLAACPVLVVKGKEADREC